ncbi:MAG: putative acyl-CoA thioester hydrolase [Pseudomonas sp.]|nr:MAG: putative acyl-CoA thioester hydrolase [Pseudomonas sp.]
MTTRLEEIQRRTDLSVTHVTKAVFPPTTNHHNTLFGGTALAWMDEVSFITATRFCRLPLVTVSTDRIDFNHAIPAGSIVELIGRVIKVGNTSLKVEVQVFVESMSADGRERAIQGVFSFVAIDADKRPAPSCGYRRQSGSHILMCEYIQTVGAGLLAIGSTKRLVTPPEPPCLQLTIP